MRLPASLVASVFLCFFAACSGPSQQGSDAGEDAEAQDVFAPDVTTDAGKSDVATADAPAEAAQDAAPQTCTPSGTTSAASFPLGDLGLANVNHSFSTCEIGGSAGAWWGDVDFTGDGMPDGVGFGTGCTAAWKIYPWTSSGFGNAKTWNLPSPSGSVTSWSSSPSGGVRQCGTGKFAEWNVYDIDGDHIPDLVWWRDDCDSTWNSNQWRVYLGSSSGFASSWTAWSVPEPVYTSASTTCASGHASQWFMNDFDADGKPDVIATRDCADSNVGVTYWTMYAGTATGMATTGKSLALPSLTSVLAPYVGSYGAPVAVASGSATCNHNSKTGTLDYFVHDLDGDGHLDLVITKDDCDSASVGTSVWRLYAGTGTTFATSPASWSLPSQLLTGIWQNYGYGAKCSSANWTSWDFGDYTGDKRPEIVIDHDDCVDKTVKSTHWNVYVNTGSGFATNATTWSFPLTVPTNTQHACGFSDGSFLYVYWQTRDITGDGIPDFILTENGCGNDATLGVDHWAVYAGKCQ